MTTAWWPAAQKSEPCQDAATTVQLVQLARLVTEYLTAPTMLLHNSCRISISVYMPPKKGSTDQGGDEESCPGEKAGILSLKTYKFALSISSPGELCFLRLFSFPRRRIYSILIMPIGYFHV